MCLNCLPIQYEIFLACLLRRKRTVNRSIPFVFLLVGVWVLRRIAGMDLVFISYFSRSKGEIHTLKHAHIYLACSVLQ